MSYIGPGNELSRRCRDMLREKGSLRADDVSVQAMRDEGLDPEADRKLRADFTRRNANPDVRRAFFFLCANIPKTCGMLAQVPQEWNPARA
jgi:hypothetical protein